MSLRDHFAGLALQGMLAGIYSDPNETEEGWTMETDPEDFRLHAAANALNAYAFADAMLAARDRSVSQHSNPLSDSDQPTFEDIRGLLIGVNEVKDADDIEACRAMWATAAAFLQKYPRFIGKEPA